MISKEFVVRMLCRLSRPFLSKGGAPLRAPSPKRLPAEALAQAVLWRVGDFDSKLCYPKLNHIEISAGFKTG